MTTATPTGTVIGNTASVTSTTPDPTVPNTASANVTSSTQADLSITKSAAPLSPIAGQALTYTITVTQNGPSDAVNVTVTDPLPSAVLFQSITAAGWSCTTPPVGSSGTVSCTRTPLSAGVYTITIQSLVATATPTGTVIGNTVSATSTTPDPTTPNTATANVTASALADLSITLTGGPNPVGNGETLVYLVVVTNSGPSDAANPSVSVTLDPALQFTSLASSDAAAAALASAFTCTTPAVGTTGTVVCRAASLAKGASASFTIATSVHVLASGPSHTITTTATATSSTTDPTPANNSTGSAIVVVNPVPTLSDVAFVAMAALLALVAMLRLRRSSRA